MLNGLYAAYNLMGICGILSEWSFYYLSISVGQESRCRLAKPLLRVPQAAISVSSLQAPPRRTCIQAHSRDYCQDAVPPKLLPGGLPPSLAMWTFP